MTASAIARYLNPWRFKREEAQRRLAELRRRDGDDCRRCRRPLRFDLPLGHDLAPKLEQILPGAKNGTAALDNLCLCHGRCNAEAGDATSEVEERLRLRDEAAANSRRRRQPRRACA